MKKLFRTLLCSALLAASLCLPALAAGDGLLIASNPNAVPEKQGDFYVLVNGEYVTFPDAVPQIRNDRSCLPFVAVFEQLGFHEMTWDGETSTVTATKPDVTYIPFNGGEARQGDVTVSLTIGDNTFTVSYEGDTTADSHGRQAQVSRGFTSEIAPYIDPATSRTYIPFGLVAQALGYNVGWDAAAGAVIIDDVDAILAENEATYKLMEKYWAYSKQQHGQNLQFDGDFYSEIFSTETLEDGSPLTTVIWERGTAEMILKGTEAFQFQSDLEVGMSFYMGEEDVSELMLAILDLGGLSLPMTIQYQQLGDTAANTLYTSPSADLLLEAGGEDIWELSSLDESPYKAMLMSPEKLLTENLPSTLESSSFEDVVAAMLRSHYPTDVNETCTDLLAEMNTLYADASFEKSGSTYTSSIQDESTAVVLSIFTSGSKVTGYALDTIVLDPLAGNETGALMEIIVSKKNDNMTILMDFAPPESGEGMYLELSGTYKTTSKEPVTTPPADAVILDTRAPEAP